MTREELIAKMKNILQHHAGARKKDVRKIFPANFGAGKLFEAYVLSEVAERLVRDEGCTLTLAYGRKLVLRGSHGPINRQFSYIKVIKNRVLLAELWTDVEFLSLSHSRVSAKHTTAGDFHELDIALIKPNLPNGRIPHDALMIAIECKDRQYGKGLLREILGIRREMSYLTGVPMTTGFSVWPQSIVPANPPSCIVVYCSDPSVKTFSSPGNVFGIRFEHCPM